PNPAPRARRGARPATTHDSTSASTRPGTAMPASGIATRFATTPIGATVPKANAVIGAVTTVAATAGATSRRARGARAVARSAQITAPIAVTESQAPTECNAHGSASSSTRPDSAITPRGATTRWRNRATSAVTSITTARVAGAGNASNQR